MKPKEHDWTIEDYDAYRREVVRKSQARRRDRALNRRPQKHQNLIAPRG